MSKNQLIALLSLGAISLGLTGCGQVPVETEPAIADTDVVELEETPTAIFPHTDDEYLLRLQQETKADPVKLDWFITIQEETKHLDFELMGVRGHSSLHALLNDESSGPHLLFLLDIPRDEYVSYALGSEGKAFDDEFDIRDLSEKYRNTLFDLLDSDGYTIYSYENGKECISVNDWLED